LRLKYNLVGVWALLALAGGGVAWAQAPAADPDPIGALLELPQEEPADPNDPEAEPPPAPYQAPAAPVAPLRPPPSAASTTPTAPGRPTRPVNIDELGRTPDYPPSAVDLNYEARLRASSASAQGLQGPLDGPWTLRSTSGRELYSLLLVDNAQALEGAWRDPRRRGATDASGFLNDIQRSGGGIVITFYPAPGAGLATLTLTPAADGSWAGELEERGERQRVTLRRN
jgi:hypothetical protein